MAIRELKVCLLGVSPGSILRGSRLLRAFVPALPASRALPRVPRAPFRAPHRPLGPRCSRAPPIAASAAARLATLGLSRLRVGQGGVEVGGRLGVVEDQMTAGPAAPRPLWLLPLPLAVPSLWNV